MNASNELMQISKVTDHIFLSGIYPMEKNYQIIKKLNIKYILCCVDKKYVDDIHAKIISDNSDITILYLPYNDDIYQNLWKSNKNLVKLSSHANKQNKMSQIIELYQNKPMIEIGYHFIDVAVSSGENILIHCMAGISRSVSLVVYYLMKKYHINFNKAYAMSYNVRSIANPNESFKVQLIEYETKRDQLSETDIDIMIDKLKNKRF